VTCPSCGGEHAEGKKFCSECGAALGRNCTGCGSPLGDSEKFCSECGTPAAGGPRAAAPPAPAAQPTAERRLVSVLFADLVGFTSLSEGRDSEETRELLSTYFETARTVIERYGGTIEKFIGDAVMAVWGAPVAQEDDAERAVRAGLDLVAAVPELDAGLKARAGVLTGEAAVTLGAQNQGMVAGDLVNTASRIQSAAEPGTVLVGDSTKRATEAAIAYADAGSHEMKGKAESTQLWRASRVTAGRAGSLKAVGLEPPFVGRDRELRLVKELFHASAEEEKAHLVSVIGIAGIGKSRTAWEFEKYIDGLAGTIWWHRGRCLAYGEGVAYWALAEMVRMRAEIVEGEEPAVAAAKLKDVVALHLSDPEERGWVETRLSHLIGIEDSAAHDRDDLFAAWRLFFERMAETQPLVMVFEDLQWADTSLLEFIEYLLEWSRSHPIFVLALARPEISERHPAFGNAIRNATTLSLEPLSERAMGELLDGFVPGLPAVLRDQILARAEGVPLYAVETVRMLLDRGLLEPAGDVYRPTGPIEALDVPETLHALIAARLDGLSAAERRLVQDASVLGKVFFKQALAQLTGQPEDEVEPVLASLVRKEVISLQSDPRSPERGQYAFLQDLLRRIAYETLAKAERKARHLAAVSFIEHDWGPAEQEIAEVIAYHLVAAYDTAPDAADAGEIKARARTMLARAGERAASLAASEEAQRYFEKAAELADAPIDRGELWERAGQMAWLRGQGEDARGHFEAAIELFDAEGATHPSARTSARLGAVDFWYGQLDQAIERMEQAFTVLSADEPDEDLATLAAELGRQHLFRGEFEQAGAMTERALEIAQALWLPEVLAQALNTKGVIAGYRKRSEEALALLRHSLALALEYDLTTAALRAYNNLGDFLFQRDRYAEALELEDRALALARKTGQRNSERSALSEMSYGLYFAGRWDESIARADELGEVDEAGRGQFVSSLQARVAIALARGDLDEAQSIIPAWAPLDAADDVQASAVFNATRAAVETASGQPAEARAAAERALDSSEVLHPGDQALKAAFVAALEAALAAGDLEGTEQLIRRIEALAPGHRPPFLRAQAARFHARLAAARGEHDHVEQGFKTAEQIFREHSLPFWLAVAQLEHAEWLATRERGEDAASLLDEARDTLERLGAAPWLERLDSTRREAATA
jgi:class 3 adenylate cyclase/tetratricopeptide (TPR) repeat protein